MNCRFFIMCKGIMIVAVLVAQTAFCDGKCSITGGAGGIQIQNQSLRMSLAGEDAGMRIKSIIPNNGKNDFFASAPSCNALWKLVMTDGKAERIVGPINLKNTIKIEDTEKGKNLTIKWNPIFLEKGSVQVTVQIKISDADPLVRMRIKVDNNSNMMLERVVFPYMSGVGPLSSNLGEDILIWPRTCGKLVRNPYKTKIPASISERYPYPSASWSMQFTGIYSQAGGGLYFAAYDPDCYIKRFLCEPERSGKSIEYFLENFPAGMNKPGNDYDMPYDAIIGTFPGDWWNAAKMYRSWATQQPWCRQMTVLQDPSVPQSIKDSAMWVQLNRDPDKVLRDALEFKRIFGVKFALHYYRWHQIPFDSFYPDFFPPLDGFKEAVEQMRKENILVMPYINVRLWNTKGVSYKKDNAQNGAVWDKSGKVFTEDYNKHTFAIMLPSSELWQNKIASICDELVTKYDVAGVYLDQLSAVGPVLSYNPHEKTSGGGNYWAAGYWKMVDKINAELKGKPAFFTSESYAEPYISRINGGYLVWVSYGQNDIPLAQAVYGGKATFWGRAFDKKDLQGEAYYAKLGDMLVNGIQIGWLQEWLLKDNAKNQCDYAVRLVKTYDAVLRKPFLDGEMIKAPTLTGVSDKVTSNWAIFGTTTQITRPAVLTGAWKCSDGETLALMINISPKPQMFSIDSEFIKEIAQKKEVNIWSTDRPKWKPLTGKITIKSHHAAVISWSDGKN